jgi:hypothetical protein
MRDNIDEDETRRGGVILLRQHKGVEGCLAAIAIKSFLCVQIVKVDGEVQGLDLVDPDGPSVFEDHTIGTARDLHRPAVNLQLHLGVDFASKTWLGGLQVCLNAPVELGADPEAGEPSPGEADRTLGGLAEEIADCRTDSLSLDVDRDCHDRRRRRRTW